MFTKIVIGILAFLSALLIVLAPRHADAQAGRSATTSEARDVPQNVREKMLQAFMDHAGASADSEKLSLASITLGFDVPNFAKQGEKIWEGRMMDYKTSKGKIRGILWVNAETLDVLILAAPGKRGSSTLPRTKL